MSRLLREMAEDTANMLTQFAKDNPTLAEALETLGYAGNALVQHVQEMQQAQAGQQFDIHAAIEGNTARALAELILQFRQQVYTTLAQAGVEYALAREMTRAAPPIVTPTRAKIQRVSD